MPELMSPYGAKSLTIHENNGGTFVAEGPHGFDATYDVFLRPCTSEIFGDIQVNLDVSVEDQIILVPSVLQWSDFDVNNRCKAEVKVIAVDDSVGEGDHFVTIQHNVTTTAGEPIFLSDESILLVQSVLVQIYDDDAPGVIIRETNGTTATAEMRPEDAPSDSSFYEDSYFMRLTKSITGTVNVDVESMAVKADKRGLAAKQVFVNGVESHTVTFTSSNWNQEVEIVVSAIDDSITEGVDFLNFASQPSNLGLIQGPIVISGGFSPNAYPLGEPLTLPNESNPPLFVVPPGVVIDTTMYYVREEKQIDTVIFNHLDTLGELPSVGTLNDVGFFGMSMIDELFVFGDGPHSGIKYEKIEVLMFNLGGGIDDITVENTTETINVMNMGAENDTVRVKQLSGPLLVNGQEGADTVILSSDEYKVDLIDSIFGFDGGIANEGDRLHFDNTGDNIGLDDVVNVTRGRIEVPSMEVAELDPTENVTNPSLPRNSYIITLRQATGGSFTLTLDDIEATNRFGLVTNPISYPTTARVIANEIDSVLIPDDNSCGRDGLSFCSPSVLVYQLGSDDISQVFAIFFAGQRLNETVTLALNTDNLVDFVPETFESTRLDLMQTTSFQGKFVDFVSETFESTRLDLIHTTSDVAYRNVDILDITTGHLDTVFNVRGTASL